MWIPEFSEEFYKRQTQRAEKFKQGTGICAVVETDDSPKCQREKCAGECEQFAQS
jgi:hypothetical protein